MRAFRMLVAAAGLAAALFGLGACAELSAKAGAPGRVAPAAARSGVWVQVSPNSIRPGFSVQVRADCGDNSNPATVTSDAFGSITVQPWNTLLLAEVTIPKTTAPGTFTVTVKCRTGSTATTTVTIIAASAAPPVTRGPNTGGGYLARSATSGYGSAPLGWFAIGAAALLTAVVIAVTSRRRRRRRRRAPLSAAGPPRTPDRAG